MNAQEQTCRQCGVKLGPDVAEGVCPACALRAALLPTANERVIADPALPSETTVHYFGDYELLAEIGRGGMGVVYRARQTKLNRPVALKMILAGRLASEADVKRFQQEAQAAANLQHPNIVAVHEVGQHDGQHYYSMDLVEGRSLAELVRQQPLPAQQAAGYLKTVADAVHYAHQHGTLHRDLQPANILIDGRDEPRITDFGLARCEHFDSHLTTTGQLLGTPAFMSPEQAQAKPEALGPASDVYSIGAVLYYLLTQRPPFAAESLPALLDQVVHHEPVSPRALNPSVPRDLETVCLKCLQKDPADRFDSALDLSLELGRFCKGEPILSRPPGGAERAWRWCARNRAVAGALATVLAVLAVGTAVSTWEAVRARAEAAKSRQTARFLQDMLKSVGPSVARGRDTKLLREILDQTAKRVGTELKDQPEVEADLLGTIGSVYLQLGDYRQAEAIDREGLRLRKKVFGAEHRKVADALNNLANALYRASKLTEAEATHRETLAMRQKLLGAEHADVASSLNNLANVLWAQGKLAEAETLDRQALALRRKLLGNTNEDVAESLDNLAGVLSLEDKLSEAEAMQREAVELNQKLLGPNHPDLAISLNNLADTLHAEGKLPEAEKIDRDVLALRQKLLGAEHPDVAFSLYNLATVLADEGKLAEAETLHRDALAMRQRLLGTNHLDVAASLDALAATLIQENRFDEAETDQRQALAIQRESLGAEHQDIAGSLDNLAMILKARGKLDEAEATERRALAMRQKLLGAEHLDVALSLNNLADVLHSEHKLAEAETLQRKALALRKKLLGNEHSDVAVSLGGLADVLFDEGKLGEAEGFQQEELALRRRLLQKQSPYLPASVRGLADVCSRLTRTLLTESKFPEAESLAREGLAFGEKHLPDDWQTFNARSLLGESLLGQKKFPEAEPLLLSGYEGLKQRQDKIPADHKSLVKESAQRLVRLYEAMNRPDQAAVWKKKLEAE